MGHTVELSVSQKEYKRHSLPVLFRNLAWVIANITIPVFKHTNITNYTRTPAQNLLKFREGKRRTTYQTTHKTCCELLSSG